jgi:hypothetical protein
VEVGEVAVVQSLSVGDVQGVLVVVVVVVVQVRDVAGREEHSPLKRF